MTDWRAKFGEVEFLRSVGAAALALMKCSGCRFPLGDPHAATFHYCGAPIKRLENGKLSKFPYCDAHYVLCTDGKFSMKDSY